MSVFEFLSPAETFERNKIAIDGGIWGLRGILADRLSHPPTRTATGLARRPEAGYAASAHGDLGKFKIILRTERRDGPEYGPGMAAVVYTDGTEDLFDYQDLLCVERPILPVHYGESRTACGQLGKYDTVTRYIPGITCKDCHRSVHATV